MTRESRFLHHSLFALGVISLSSWSANRFKSYQKQVNHRHYGAVFFTHLETVEDGRLGNKNFQNLALSLLAQKYNVPVNYLLLDECSRLGISLYSGTQLMSGSPFYVNESNIQLLLEANSTRLENRSLLLNKLTPPYFQIPWFANLLRYQIFPQMGADLFRANPWRNRIGRNNDIFVHIRLGDKATAKDVTRSANDYISAISFVAERNRKLLNTNEIFIASDSPSHPLVSEVARYFDDATIVDELNRVETIQFGSTAQNIILSDGTFSWVIGVFAATLANFTNSQHPLLIKWLPRKDIWHGNIFIFNDWERI
jgi:hypothetical protein